MAWKEVNTNATDIKKHKGEEFTGVFKGHKDITTSIGPQVVWQFTGEDGLAFGIYGFTNLNRALEGCAPGTFLKITYLGTENVKTKYGMKDVHQVQVDVWEKAEGEEDYPA